MSSGQNRRRVLKRRKTEILFSNAAREVRAGQLEGMEEDRAVEGPGGWECLQARPWSSWGKHEETGFSSSSILDSCIYIPSIKWVLSSGTIPACWCLHFCPWLLLWNLNSIFSFVNRQPWVVKFFPSLLKKAFPCFIVIPIKKYLQKPNMGRQWLHHFCLGGLFLGLPTCWRIYCSLRKSQPSAEVIGRQIKGWENIFACSH